MKLFRLIHSDHDTITIGASPVRGSDRSNQKLGDGIYLSDSIDALHAFAGSATCQYSYSHVLTFEFAMDESAFELSETALQKRLDGQSVADFLPAYCASHGKAGVFHAMGDALEYVVYPRNDRFEDLIVTAADPLPEGLVKPSKKAAPTKTRGAARRVTD
jgi:hypothetical protein